MTSDRMNRRRLLANASALGALAIAGCTSGDSGGDRETTTDETTTEPTATDKQTTEAPTTQPPATTLTPSRSAAQITVENNAFDPVVTSIAPDTEVEWVNEDDVEHVVQSTQFNDGAESWDFFVRLFAGNAGSTVMRSEGVYEYYCSVHGRATMCGVVLVGDVSLAGSLPCQDDDGTTTP